MEASPNLNPAFPVPPAVLPPAPPAVPPPRPFSSPPARLRPKILPFLAAALLLGLIGLIITIFLQKGTGRSKAVINYWGIFEPSSVFQQVIADYEKAHPNVKINYSQEDLKTYRERLQAALARNEGPDIFRMHQTWVPMLGNYLSPLPSTVYDAASFEKTFYPSAKESLRYQGRYVAIPLEFDGLALFYNEDLFRSTSKAPPRTWVELRKTACELTVKDQGGKIVTAGVALGTAGNVDGWSDILGLMMLQNGADLGNPAYCQAESGSAVSGEEVCFGRDTLSFYSSFAGSQACQNTGVEAGPVWNDLMPNSTYAFATGKLAMYFGPSWRVFEIKELNPNLNFKIVPVPQLEGKNTAWASFWVEGVAKNSKFQPEAWEFLQYLSSKEVLQKLYQTESALRLFGEPYPRVEMAEMLKGQPLVGAFIEQAPNAKSWYISSRTGDNGLNDQIIKYYEDAVNGVNQGQDPLSALKTAGQGVAQVLRQYGIIR